jgi:hypothetical protein
VLRNRGDCRTLWNGKAALFDESVVEAVLAAGMACLAQVGTVATWSVRGRAFKRGWRLNEAEGTRSDVPVRRSSPFEEGC